MLQTTALFIDRRPTARFEGGILVAFSCTFVELALILANTSFRISDPRANTPFLGLLLTQATLLVVVFISSLAIQRRPDVYVGEKRVDGQFTASVWDKYTFQWTWPSLDYARKNKGLKLEDVPLLPGGLRASILSKQFHRSYVFRRLWMRLLWYFKWGLLLSTSLVSISALLQFAPQLAMLNILRLLESKAVGEKIAFEAYLWVIGLGISMLVSTFVETWMFWIVEAVLGIRARGVLSALIFEKATRRKNAQGSQKNKGEATVAEAGGDEAVILNEASGREEHPQTETQAGEHSRDTVVAEGEAQQEKKDDEEDEEAEAKKTRQGVINLIAVDTQRCQFFLSYFYLFPNAFVKIIISVTFLVQVVGWIPLLSGFAAFACTIPFNIFWSKKFVGKSNDLMKFRDQKLATVTEALQGVKQIKYSAIEQQWQNRIGEKRTQELKTQRAAFMYDIGLVACWISGEFCIYSIQCPNIADKVKVRYC